jgi:hypothetical protein
MKPVQREHDRGVAIGAVYAAPARPHAVSFETVKRVDVAGSPTRIGTSVKRKNNIAGAPFLRKRCYADTLLTTA